MSIDTMKKMGLSLFIVLLFVAYSFQQRNDNEASAVVAPNTTSTAKNADNSTSSTTSDNSSMSNMPSSSLSHMSSSVYKDGTYTGSRSDAVYGFIQVQATVSGGKITNVVFLEYPNDHHESIQINRQAMPMLKEEAIQAQSAQVDGVSGATDTSAAFVESLNVALNKAKS